ncbi:MAG: flagellin [Microvirga sp.]|nr:flagellin [Beijerinckiaceae bacterium]
MDISLTSGVRAALTSIQQTNAAAQEAQLHLATGKKVNSALDNPSNYFTASALSGRANDLSRIQDSIGQAVKTLEAASNGISSISKLVETAQSLANQALDTTDTATRTKLQTQYNQVRTQIDELAKDSGYNGVNLVKGTPDNLTVIFNEKTGAAQSKLAITGAALDSAGLAVSDAATLDTGTNGAGWAHATNGTTNINASLTELSAALTTLRTQASTFGANLTVVKNRQEFTASMINTLKTGADQLVLADSNEEGANLLALNTRGQLAQTALQLAAQRDQAVLRLF